MVLNTAQKAEGIYFGRNNPTFLTYKLIKYLSALKKKKIKEKKEKEYLWLKNHDSFSNPVKARTVSSKLKIKPRAEVMNSPWNGKNKNRLLLGPDFGVFFVFVLLLFLVLFVVVWLIGLLHF